MWRFLSCIAARAAATMIAAATMQPITIPTTLETDPPMTGADAPPLLDKAASSPVPAVAEKGRTHFEQGAALLAMMLPLKHAVPKATLCTGAHTLPAAHVT